ncbi:MAG TPA: short-chain fatty acyl-CoA regulator family protein [Kofleriaceae bacterium]|nr:short-chain fatty acyl-CoA regulator family protein [Kofleriaceae bacterium]
MRELRLERGIGQAELARTLEISAAYLNLLEKGRRNMQFPLLLKALDKLDVELDRFMALVGEEHPDDVLAHLLDDPLAKSLELTGSDLARLRAEPRVASTIAALFHLYKNTRAQLDTAVSRLESDAPMPIGYAPGDEVSDFLQANDNYFPELEEHVAAIRKDAALPRRFVSEQLMEAVRRRFELDVALESSTSGSSVVRTFDREQRRLRLSSAMSENALKFQLGHVVGLLLLEQSGLHDRLMEGRSFRHSETSRLIKIHLANYFAGAMLLPYRDFFDEVQRTRYDVEKVATAFESSYETVAHRMCNLADPKRPGVPLHFLRVDVAGNISKRYSASGMRFPHGHGSCPKWAVHAAFLTPALISRQYSVMPDGSTFFCFAKVITDPAAGSLVRGTIYAIGLGSSADNAHAFVYADGMPTPDPRDPSRIAVPVGVTCRFCERPDCNQRAAPSYKYAFAVDEYVKKENFFSPMTVTKAR